MLRRVRDLVPLVAPVGCHLSELCSSRVSCVCSVHSCVSLMSCIRIECTGSVVRAMSSSNVLRFHLGYSSVLLDCCSFLLVPSNILINNLNKLLNNKWSFLFSSNVKYQCMKKRKLKRIAISLITLIQCYIYI